MTCLWMRRLARCLALGLCGLLPVPAAWAACAPGALIEALSQARVTAARSATPAWPDAAAVPAAELAGLPALGRVQSLLGQVGLPWAWHRLGPPALEVALDAAGGVLVVAQVPADGAEPVCEVWTQSRTASLRAGEAGGAATATPALLALLPLAGARAPEAAVSVHEALREMQADFRLAMRVGGQYAPRGVWVLAPWLSGATLERSQAVLGPLPGLQGRADTRARVSAAGIGLTRGLTRDTALTLMLQPQRSALDTVVSFPAIGPWPAQQVRRSGHQSDTLVGIGLYSQWLRADGPRPAVLLQARAFAPSAHSRASGAGSLTALHEGGSGWALAATVGAEAERPEGAPSRQARVATLGASTPLAARWMLTVDAGRRDLRGQPGTEPVERLRLYRSLGPMAYLALVIDQEGPDRRATLTFARPW